MTPNDETQQYNNVCVHRFNNIDKQLSTHITSQANQFDNLNKYIKEMADDRKEDIRDIKKVINRIDKTVNIGNGEPPLVLKVDRLTQDHNRTQWWKRIAITAIVGLVVFAVEENIRYSIQQSNAQETVVKQQQLLLKELSEIKGTPISLIPTDTPVLTN